MNLCLKPLILLVQDSVSKSRHPLRVTQSRSLTCHLSPLSLKILAEAYGTSNDILQPWKKHSETSPAILNNASNFRTKLDLLVKTARKALESWALCFRSWALHLQSLSSKVAWPAPEWGGAMWGVE